MVSAADAFFETQLELNELKRNELEAEWWEKTVEQLEGERMTFRYTVSKLDQVSRGVQEFRFSRMEHGFGQDQRSNLLINRTLKLKLSDTRARKIKVGDVVEISGVVRVAFRTPFNEFNAQNRYLPLFIYRRSACTITVAVERFRVKYVTQDAKPSADKSATE